MSNFQGAQPRGRRGGLFTRQSSGSVPVLDAPDKARDVTEAMDREAYLEGHREVDELLARKRVSAQPQGRVGISRDSRRRRALAVADVCALVLSYLLVAFVLFPVGAFASGPVWLLPALPLWILLNKLLGLYDRDPNVLDKSTLNEFPHIVQSIALGAGALYFVSPDLEGPALSREETLGVLLIATVLTAALRAVARSSIRRSTPPERALVVGDGYVTEAIARKLQAHPEHGVCTVGVADATGAAREGADQETDGSDPLARFEIRDVAGFERICRELAVERVIVAFPNFSHERSIELIKASKLLNLKVTVVPRLFEVIGSGVEVDELEGMTLLGLRGFTRTRSSLALKRAMDMAVAALGLTALAPVLVAIAVGVKLGSSGPVLYGQRRIGRDNEPFRLLKFRTMVHRADELKPELMHLNEASSPMFKIAADPRVTRVGAFLRRTSLDELPQLWNVLRGEMSLVGPRPLVPEEDDHVIGWHRSRLRLTPGLTGPWQVLGRTAIPFQEMVTLDYLYVVEWSLWNDVKLLVRTAPVILSARGQ